MNLLKEINFKVSNKALFAILVTEFLSDRLPKRMAGKLIRNIKENSALILEHFSNNNF